MLFIIFILYYCYLWKVFQVHKLFLFMENLILNIACTLLTREHNVLCCNDELCLTSKDGCMFFV